MFGADTDNDHAVLRLPFTVSAAEGSCGDNLTWRYDESAALEDVNTDKKISAKDLLLSLK